MELTFESTGDLFWTGSVSEECCNEGCTTEEYAESTTYVSASCYILPLANLLNIHGLTWIKEGDVGT